MHAVCVCVLTNACFAEAGNEGNASKSAKMFSLGLSVEVADERTTPRTRLEGRAFTFQEHLSLFSVLFKQCPRISEHKTLT